jgi:hypothetical protein
MLEDKKDITPGLFDDLKKLGSNILPDISGAMSEVYQKAVDLNDVFGQNKERLSEIQRVIFDIRPGISALGGSMSDVYRILEDVSKVTSKNVLATAQDAKELFATEKVIGGTVRDIVENFTEVGIQVSKIGDEAEKAVNYVQSMGLNTKDIFELVSRNFEKLNAYNFADGVQGLAKMASTAAMFKFDMSETFRITDKALDPQGAVELASAFQRMGVAVGDLTDPFQLMYKSLNDPEGIQESLSQMTKKFTYFDEKTKTFKISPEGILQMRELNKQTGISYETLSKSALAAANMDKAISQIKPGIKFESEDDKRMLANIARMGKGGEYEVKLKGQDEAVKLSELTQEQIKDLLEEQRNAPKTLEETALASLNLEEKLNADVNAIRNKLEGYVGSQPVALEFTTQMDKLMAGLGTEVQKIFPDVPSSREFFRDIKSSVSTEISKLARGEKLTDVDIQNLQSKIKKIEDDLVQKGGDRFRGATGAISNLVSSSYADYKKYGLGIGDGTKMKPKAQITNTKVDMGGTVTFKVDAGSNVNTRDLENYINSNDFKKKFFDTLLQMDSNTRTNLRRNLGIS